MIESSARDCLLVIDDDPSFRQMIRLLCEFEQIPVFEAKDCPEGLAILDREWSRIRLVLLDYFMPGLQPVQCADAVKARAGDEITIVLATAAVDAGKRAAELGILKWLSKPFDPDTLLQFMKKAG